MHARNFYSGFVFSFAITLVALGGATVAHAQTSSSVDWTGLPKLPGGWTQVNADKAALHIKDGTLQIVPAAGTNLFHAPGGGFDVVNAPMVLFAPQGDFTLKAKISAQLVDTYDVGALVVYGDDAHWVKLCYENSPRHEATVVSVVTRERSDDINSETIASPFVYMALARQGNVFTLHFSRDGREWRLVRHFEMPFGPGVRVGFAAHSDAPNHFSATFSEITYRAMAPKDMRQLQPAEVAAQ
jgi:regulation of enolase protein 1 (concanavalin A-like superfamily)